MTKLKPLLIYFLIAFAAVEVFFYLKNGLLSNETTTNDISYMPTESGEQEPNEIPVIVAAAGDISCETDLATPVSCQDKLTAQIIEKINPDAVLALGDLQYYNGKYESFLNFYDKTWGKFKEKTFPTPGNHDYRTKGAEGYFKYFGERAHKDIGGYYSFDLGSWHFISLNSNCWETPCDTQSNQLKWLKEDLQKNSKKCTLAYWHHPRFSSGKVNGSYEEASAFWEVLYKEEADLILNGHEHLYERFERMNPQGNKDLNGIVQIVAGNGGNSLYPFGKALDGSKARINKSFGVLKLKLYSDSFAWEFLTRERKELKVLDSGSEKCI